MKKSFSVPIVLAFLLLFCLSCQEEPTAVQSDLSHQQESAGLAKGRPPAPEPLTCMVKLTTQMEVYLSGLLTCQVHPHR